MNSAITRVSKSLGVPRLVVIVCLVCIVVEILGAFASWWMVAHIIEKVTQ